MIPNTYALSVKCARHINGSRTLLILCRKHIRILGLVRWSSSSNYSRGHGQRIRSPVIGVTRNFMAIVKDFNATMFLNRKYMELEAQLRVACLSINKDYVQSLGLLKSHTFQKINKRDKKTQKSIRSGNKS